MRKDALSEGMGGREREKTNWWDWCRSDVEYRLLLEMILICSPGGSDKSTWICILCFFLGGGGETKASREIIIITINQHRGIYFLFEKKKKKR